MKTNVLSLRLVCYYPKITNLKKTFRRLLNKIQNNMQLSELNNKCCRGCGENGTLLHCWWECELVRSLWKTIWRFLKKLKIELPYDSAIPLLGIYLEKTLIWKDACTPVFLAALCTTVKKWKQPKCPSMDQWIKKMWCIYIYIYIYTHTHTLEYYSAIKKMK